MKMIYRRPRLFAIGISFALALFVSSFAQTLASAGCPTLPAGSGCKITAYDIGGGRVVCVVECP